MMARKATRPILTETGPARPAASELPITLYRVDIDALWTRGGYQDIDMNKTAGDGMLHWLSASERQAFRRLRVPKRRRDWLAGRYAAKWVVRAQRAWAGVDWDRIEIRPVPEGPDRGRPRVFVDGEAAAVDLSISHSGRVAVAAAVVRPGLRLGIDVEDIAGRAESFEALALAPSERHALSQVAGRARADAVTQRWALKEALMKATGTGLRARLTTIDIFATLRGQFPVHHPVTGEPLTIAGWGSEIQGDVVYAWVALKSGVRIPGSGRFYRIEDD